MKYKLEPNGAVKVDEKVRPIHFRDRKKFDLKMGGHYFICFGSNLAYPCLLTKINLERGVVIVQHQEFCEDGNGYTMDNELFLDEIGRTPEEAVINSVTL